MNITFCGAAGGVTGSKHLVEAAGKKILLDCGTFQGLADVRERNRSLPFPPDSIDAVVLSHAHLDHCGMLPLLVKRGFTGPIFATPATVDVAKYMLNDAAAIEEQDAEYRGKHRIGAPDSREPLFTAADVADVLKQFVAVPYAREAKGWQAVASGIDLKFYDAGHILGSAVSVLRIQEEGKNERYVAYTGDLGPQEQPLMRPPEVPVEPISTLLLESTYGGRVNHATPEVEKRLIAAITAVLARDGKMIVPAFSLGRTQSFLYTVHKLIDDGKIPRFPVYVDSPLATGISGVYRTYAVDYDKEAGADFPRGGDEPLSFRNLRYVASVEESKNLNVQPGPFMIVSASGMMTAGRVVHHLRHCIGDPRNAIFITGYQAEGTVGRQLVEGNKRLELHGDLFPVKAQVCIFNEFSAHADQAQLLQYVRHLPGLKQIMLVHGEREQAEVLRLKLAEVKAAEHVLQPEEGQTYELL